jgi:D-aspartate ligase
MGARATETAIVAEVGWVNGLAAVRSLGRAGLHVVAVDHRPWALGFKSRYCERVLCTDPLDDDAGFVRDLGELAASLDGPIPIFPTHDEHLNAIARNVDALPDHLLYPFPGWETLERIQSKRHQLARAEEIGLSVPRTFHPRTRADALAAAEEIGYPVLVKPSDNVVYKHLYKRQLFRCDRPDELERAYDLTEQFEPMVQEAVPGGDEELYTLGSYLSPDGEALGLFCGRKLRQTREGMGSCRVGESVWVEEVVDYGLRLLDALAFHGISQVEVKRDPRDGRYKLIEVNPRLWQWHGLAAACGVDLPWIAYCDLVGRRPAPARMNGEGKRWAITFMDWTSPAAQRPPYVDAVFARDDPGPALAQAVRLGRKAVERVRIGRVAAKEPAQI